VQDVDCDREARPNDDVTFGLLLERFETFGDFVHLLLFFITDFVRLTDLLLSCLRLVSKNGVNEEQRRNKLQSKFVVEANKASLEDVERLLTDKNRMPKKSNRIRRNSAPLLSMPEGFLIEISENSKGRRHDRSKSVRRTKSVGFIRLYDEFRL
jgi:hypothetical protein